MKKSIYFISRVSPGYKWCILCRESCVASIHFPPPNWFVDTDEPQEPLPLTVDSSLRNENIASTSTIQVDSNRISNSNSLKLKRRIGGERKLIDIKDEKNIEKRSRRGKYANYEPVLRAEIAKYAMEHTNQDTINFFREKKNIEGNNWYVLKVRKLFFGSLLNLWLKLLMNEIW